MCVLVCVYVECLFVELCIGVKSVIVRTIYLPPNSACAVYESYYSALEDIHQQFQSSEFGIFGDFNLARTTWKNDATNDVHCFMSICTMWYGKTN